MKISNKHYAVLREAIRPLTDKLASHHAAIIAANAAKNPAMRTRWDALNASRIEGKPSCFFLSNVLYPAGLNDDHIDSALRAIMRELGFPQIAS